MSRTPCRPRPSRSATTSNLALSPAPDLRGLRVLASRLLHGSRLGPSPRRVSSHLGVGLLCVVWHEERPHRQHLPAFRALSSTYFARE